MPSSIINYVELPAGDLPVTKAFYEEAFGWTWTDYGPTYAAASSAGVEVGLNTLAAPAAPHAPGAENAIGPLVLFATDELAAVDSRVRAAGGTIVSDIYGYPGGRRFHFQDPSGNILGVYQSDPSD